MPEAYEYRDGRVTPDPSGRRPGPDPALRGRGAGLNPGNRFEPSRLHVLGDHLDEQAADPDAPPPSLPTEVIRDDSRSLINRIDSPDVGFEWSLNPYRGCEHGCVYCYARPFHEYLGLSCGIDFETKILAKPDAPALLRRELASPRWRAPTLMMSGVTDCYQPVEKRLRITRRCLEVLAECRQPVAIVTKNKLVLRDLDLLATLARHGAVAAAISIATLDPKLAAKLEPRASSPPDRLDAIRALADAGVPTGVMAAPVIPGLTDRHMPAVLEAAANAGATWAGYVMLRLPHQIKDLFRDWLDRHYPDRADHVESLIRQVRGGALYDPAFGQRMRGRGPVADQVRDLFRLMTRKLKLDGSFALSNAAFRKPQTNGQMPLFT